MPTHTALVSPRGNGPQAEYQQDMNIGCRPHHSSFIVLTVKVSALLATLRERDIQVWAEGEHLRCNAPTDMLTPELRRQLQERKSEILAFLHSASSLARQQRAIIPLQPCGTRPPIFAFGGHNGDVFCFRALAQYLGDDQPLFGFQPPGFDDAAEPLDRVEGLAAHFAAGIRQFQPDGPYLIAGFCAGGLIALELARQLLREGAPLSELILFGAPYPTAYHRFPRLRKRAVASLERLRSLIHALLTLPPGQRREYLAERLHSRKRQSGPGSRASLDPVLAQRAKVARATFAALRRYQPGRFAGRLTHFLVCEEWANSRDEPLHWRFLAQQAREFSGPPACDPDIMLLEPFAATFADLFRQSQAKKNMRFVSFGATDLNSFEARLLKRLPVAQSLPAVPSAGLRASD
jgi:thioesterase domain-containing protein